MKIGVSSYSFARMMKDGEITLNDVPALAKKIGYEGVELVSFFLPEDEHPTEKTVEAAMAFKAAADTAGVVVTSYLVSGNFIGQDDPMVEAERMMAHVDIAAKLGAGVMRFDAGWEPNVAQGKFTFIQAADFVAPAIRKVAEYAATKGVVTTSENHGRFMQDSNRCQYLISKVNHPNYGALLDLGNFLCADEDPAKAVSNLWTVAKHVHAKDFLIKPFGTYAPKDQGFFPTRGGNMLRGTIIGHGIVPLEHCLTILKQHGYDKWVMVEFEGIEDVMTAVTYAYANLKGILERI